MRRDACRDRAVIVILAFCTILLIGAGCSPASRSDPDSTLGGIPPETLLNRLHAAEKRFEDFKGSALVAATFNGQRGRVDIRIQFRRPDLLKIFIQGAFMQVLGVLRLEKDRVQLYIPEDNIVYEGTADDGDIVVPGMQVPLNDVRTAVLGMPDMSVFKQYPIIGYHREDAYYMLAVKDSLSGVIRKAWIDPNRVIVIREEEHRPDDVIIVRSFDDYKRRKGIWRPSRISIRSDKTDEDIELTYHTQAINNGLSMADLNLHLPGTVRRVPLSDADLFRR